jgi:hypothetical protein
MAVCTDDGDGIDGQVEGKQHLYIDSSVEELIHLCKGIVLIAAYTTGFPIISKDHRRTQKGGYLELKSHFRFNCKG